MRRSSWGSKMNATSFIRPSHFGQRSTSSPKIRHMRAGPPCGCPLARTAARLLRGGETARADGWRRRRLCRGRGDLGGVGGRGGLERRRDDGVLGAGGSVAGRWVVPAGVMPVRRMGAGGSAGHDLLTAPGVGREAAVVGDEVSPGRGDERAETPEEIERVEEQVGGAPGGTAARPSAQWRRSSKRMRPSGSWERRSWAMGGRKMPRSEAEQPLLGGSGRGSPTDRAVLGVR
jgi:hypothetical protein